MTLPVPVTSRDTDLVGADLGDAARAAGTGHPGLARSWSVEQHGPVATAAATPSGRAPSFGDPSRYRDVRPEYLPDLVGRIRSECDRAVSLTCCEVVLDVGCGTGALSRHLPGASVVGVDPDHGMLSHLVDEVPPVCGRAETLPVATSSVAACVVGVAYHWFRRPDALDELVRVTAPAGAVMLVGYECVHPAVAEARELSFSRLPGSFSATFDPDRFAQEFDSHPELDRVSLTWVSSATPADHDSVLALLSSYSWAVRLSDDERRRAADSVVASGAALPWRWHLVSAERR